MHKIAVIADVHGNYSALQAVLQDAHEQHATDYMVFGDIGNRGPEPAACVQALQVLQPLAWVIGNHEEVYASLLHHRFVTFEKNQKAVVAIITSAFDREHLTATQFRWLASRPLHQELVIDGVKLSIFHATPTTSRGHQAEPVAKQQNFDALLAGSDADIALYGHTHQPLMRQTTDGRYIMNPGSVGLATSLQPQLAAGRAQYGLLTIDAGRFSSWTLRVLPYDVDQELRLVTREQLPYAALYTRTLTTGAFGYSTVDVTAENMTHNYGAKAQALIAADAW